MRLSYARCLLTMSVCFFSVWTFASWVSADPDPKKPNATQGEVPVDDLVAQVDFFVERLDESLEDEKRYSEAKKARVKKDASTLAVLCLTLAKHTTDHRLKVHVVGTLAAARRLASVSDNFATARKAYDEVKTALATKSTSSADVVWQKVAELPVLMKHVPFLHERLKRGVRSESRLKKSAQDTAGYSATLAAMAQASWHILPKEAEGNPTQTDKWRSYCDRMAAASRDVNHGIHEQDFKTVQAAMGRLGRSCADCHRSFRRN